ncbi:uncharacterized protein LOC133529608 [Cydia pomonella]|uniref:uncharacterized protein LOC133529608 n=1 Tax=Cydia pomonella TaxID=82600 RepID=UPI002ADE538A|nr:uncharacterized protein LOC133529608 [Cydia pomonella]XP_061723341.1 uncharacterized protein LOC133529608 [Cydia pomonella]
MSSKRVEDKHKKWLDRILSHSGLVCVRSPPPSAQVSAATLVTEEAASTEEEEDSSIEIISREESQKEVLEESYEEESTIFPSPSLRRLVPDKIRKIEEHNRIHVLPKEFKTNIDPALIPKIVPQVRYIDIIASLVGCTEYKSSLAEFWFLDTLANLLRRAQEDLLPRTTQAVLMLWFCEWMKEIQNFDAASRKRMLRRFKDNMLSAARFIAEVPRLPTPSEAGVRYRALEEDVETHTKDARSKKSLVVEDIRLVTFEGCAYECAMRDLVTIMHYIFDLFSTDYQFDLVRSIFTFTPEYNLIDLPLTLQNPKRLFLPLKPKKEKPKKEKEVKKDKGKKKDVDTEEYLALMELKARSERELEEQEAKDAELWNMRSSILPLMFAGTDELFDKYWPPPPPEPEPEPEPKPDKGKKKK